MKKINGVHGEIYTISSVVDAASAEVVHNIGTPVSADVVKDNIEGAHILHLACHGHQMEDPLESYFSLNGGRLTVSSLMSLKLKNAMLAFLNACETAKCNEHQPDQAVHLAASLLFCGFKSVIGTMW
jgi:CHAT domain-containing protein